MGCVAEEAGKSGAAGCLPWCSALPSGLVCDGETPMEIIRKFGRRDLQELKRPRGREKQGVKLSSMVHGGMQERYPERVSRLSHRQRVGLNLKASP